MYGDILNNLLWFMGGYFFTLLGLVWIAAYYGQPELIIKGSVAYTVIWVTLNAVLLVL